MTDLKNGESGVIITINAPSNPHRGRHRHRIEKMKNKIGSHSEAFIPRMGFEKRLIDMGLTPGTRVTMVRSAPFRGPVELHVRGSRLVIGRRMAQKIKVRTVSGEEAH